MMLKLMEKWQSVAVWQRSTQFESLLTSSNLANQETLFLLPKFKDKESFYTMSIMVSSLQSTREAQPEVQ